MTELAATGEGLVAAHHAALDHTRQYVVGAAALDDPWSCATPCEQWDLHDLLDHLIGENLWVAELMAGRTVEEVGDRLDGDAVGSDPVLSWDVSARAAEAGFALPDALTSPVAVSYGPVPGELYLGHRYVDVLVHGWDLAAATDQDRTLPVDLVEVLWAVVEPQLELLHGSGLFGEEQGDAAEADLQRRTLRQLGRDPDWAPPT